MTTRRQLRSVLRSSLADILAGLQQTTKELMSDLILADRVLLLLLLLRL